MKTKYEIHINGYKLGDCLERAVLSFGFYPDNFDRTKITTHAPLHHYTYRTYESRARLNEVWNKTLEAIQNDDCFEGYIEAETVPDKYRLTFQEKPFTPIVNFPFPKCETPLLLQAGLHKASDIHIERDLDLPRDELDDLLLAHNFYEVHWRGEHEDERIFTYQTAWFGDAKKAYALLRDYIKNSGGARQVDLEITNLFLRKPSDFPVSRVLPKGFFSKVKPLT